MIEIRLGNEADRAFIITSWLRCYRKSGNEYCRPPSEIYFDQHKKRIWKHLETGKVLVATTNEDPTQIIGYAVVTGEVLQFVFVKELFRKMGVAKKLIEKAKCTQYSQHTAFSKHINKALEYNPYAF